MGQIRCRLPLLLVLCAMTASVPAFALSGQQVYVREGCSVCHGALGEGGVGPQLSGDPFVGFQDYVVGRVLLGGGEMPPFAGKISDEDIAAVASHIRESWGNSFGPVSTQQATADRQRIEGGPTLSGSTTPQSGGAAQGRAPTGSGQ